MRTNFKNNPQIKLVNILGRRKMTLADWVSQNGIFTYTSLLERCERLGVAPPSEEDFAGVIPPVPVSSPTEGIVVLPTLPIVSELTGEIVDPSETIIVDEDLGTQRRKRRG